MLRRQASHVRVAVVAFAWISGAAAAAAQAPHLPSSSTIALTHVGLIDGNGSPAVDDQTIVVSGGHIDRVGPTGRVSPPAGAEIVDLRGRTVLPGLVGMHEHLFYQLEPPGSNPIAALAPSAFAKLYLAAGVTTIRTAGTLDFNGDARLKARIEAGVEPGPKIHLTGPYLNATSAEPDPDAIAKVVADYADAGATSFKAYTSLRASELKAAIRAAHDRGLQVTGHLCAVGFREAAALGIDNLEHGLLIDTDLYYDKHPDECPNQSAVLQTVGRMDVGDSDVRETISQLINHGVAITSTLAVFESYAGAGAAFDPRVRPLLVPRLQSVYDEAAASRGDPTTPSARMYVSALRTEMAFERAFVAAGGKLLTGVDPTGWGGVVAGYGDQRELELLVDAGFRPEAAIEIATRNGASFMGERHVGTVEPGMQADLVVVRGDPAKNISDVRNVEMVFKDGVAYDPRVLVAAATGRVGANDWWQLLTWRNFGIVIVVAALVTNRARRWRQPRSAAAAI